MNRTNIFFILITLSLISCGKEVVKPSELISWVKDPSNGLVQSQNVMNYEFEAIYKPVDYIVAMEGRSDDMTKAKYHELKNSIDGMQYFDLRIKNTVDASDALSGSVENQDDYFVRLDYFITYAYQDIKLIQGTDTLSPAIYHFERTYGLTPYNTILLGFENTDISTDRTLIVDDQILGVGRLKFVFEEKNIQATPTLKLN